MVMRGNYRAFAAATVIALLGCASLRADEPSDNLKLRGGRIERGNTRSECLVFIGFVWQLELRTSEPKRGIDQSIIT